MEQLIIQRITHPDDLAKAFRLREVVFIDEQGISREAEFDGLDDRCHHLLACINDHAVGTLRLRLINEDFAKIERVVVSKLDRGRQIGAKMITEALAMLADLGVSRVELHAQTQARPFYEKLGFAPRGDIFDEDGLPHILMHLDLVV